MTPDTPRRDPGIRRTLPLLASVFLIAACGLVYELLAGTVASYLLGDSVTQFSLVIGIYLAALGAGAWLSRFIERDVARRFVEIELGVALLGGFSAPLLFSAFGRFGFFSVLLYAVVLGVGTLVGLEVPLLMRILREHLDFKELVSRVLSFDYLGSLLAAIAFPILLMPRLGLVRTSILFGLLNAGVGLYGSFLLEPWIRTGLTGLRVRGAIVVALLAAGLVQSKALTTLAEDGLYSDEVVYARSSPYQRIVVTRGRSGFHLFLNGNLQFSSADEYRYHESLVHPALALRGGARRVLVLGGGDGLALREILKYDGVKRVTLVDLDPAMTGLSARYPPLGVLNGHSFDDPRVEVVNRDAMIWLEEPGDVYDAAIVDFPDPNNFSIGKLYTTRFYRLLRARLRPAAMIAVQSTSPLFARHAFWCIVRTLEAAGLAVRPYQAAVPSFGVWGFALASDAPFEIPPHVLTGLRFLSDGMLPSLFVLSSDMAPVAVEVNRLDNQSLVRYHEADWRRWD